MVQLKEVFQEINQALQQDSSGTNGLKAVYQFDIHGEESGKYQLVLQEENSFAAEGEHEKPDCTLNIGTEDFLNMVSGNLNGTQAFMTGRLKISGNMGLALKLQSILSSYKS